MELTTIQKFAIWVLPTLFAITVHEVAHGWVASKFGDKTAVILGRVTLNPLKHIDIIGTVIVPILLFLFGGFIFGWAKAVPITTQNIKPRRIGLISVSLAGPLANLLMALVWAGIGKCGQYLVMHGFSSALPLDYMGKAGIIINLVLMILNLIPIPPLDGGRIISAFLPGRAAYYYDRLEYFGLAILLLLLSTSILNWFIQPILIFFLNLFNLGFHLS